MELVDIPAGYFQMGEEEDGHSVYLDIFQIGKFPVTTRDYRAFVEETDHPAPHHWPAGQYPVMLADHPVVNISWFDARAFCRWLQTKTGREYRLPTEAEWEKAARGPAGASYPWGNTFDQRLCNTWEGGFGRTMPVDYFPEGASYYGAMDMAGNVWEWCSSRFCAYPYVHDDGREDLTAEDWRVLRGGSWYDTDWGVRSARRLGSPAAYASPNTGFRVACNLNNERR